MLRVSAAALLFRTHAEHARARRALPKLPELIAVQIKLLPARLSGAVPARGVIDSKRPPPLPTATPRTAFISSDSC